MIIELKIKNFRSYKKEAIFSFEALPDEALETNVEKIELKNGQNIRLLKSAGIFGPNASGKSNVIWALHGLSWMISHSLHMNQRNGIPIYCPFFLDETSLNDFTTLTYKSVVDGIVYIYEIKFNAFLFAKESLWLWEKRSKNCVYSIEFDEPNEKRNLKFGPQWKDSKSELDGDVERYLFKNQLLLSKLGTMASCSFVKLYEEIAFMEVEPAGELSIAQQNNKRAADYSSNRQKTVFNRVKNLMRIADIGIVDIDKKEIKKKNPSALDYESDKIYEYIYVHEGTNHLKRPFEKFWESTGTKKLFEIGSRILLALELGLNVAYDEIDMAIHPDLFRLLISLFNDKKYNPHNAQILFTCHTPSICEDLRADQIWFAQKNKGASELYSAQDFAEAKIQMPFEVLYKSGRFGSKPKFGDKKKIYED